MGRGTDYSNRTRIQDPLPPTPIPTPTPTPEGCAGDGMGRMNNGERADCTGAAGRLLHTRKEECTILKRLGTMYGLLKETGKRQS